MIPHVEVIGKYSLKPTALIEPSQCWFELSYYGIGEFEVYCPATPTALEALRNGNYVRIPNRPYLWVIKSVQYTFNAEGARMVDAKGFEAKWIIGQRIVLGDWILPTSLSQAVFELVDENLGATALPYRRVDGFATDTPSIAIAITETQATMGNLWDFLAELLKSNHCGSYSHFDGSIRFKAFDGRNLTGSPIVLDQGLGTERTLPSQGFVLFAQSMDNLISSEYFENSADRRNFVQIVSTKTENDETIPCVSQYPDTPTSHPSVGIDRLEMLVQSNISADASAPFGSDAYKALQIQEGKNQLAEKMLATEFSGEIDLQNSQYDFETDFFLGDIVKVKDEYFGYSANARITKYTFKQDENGYGEEAEYGNE